MYFLYIFTTFLYLAYSPLLRISFRTYYFIKGCRAELISTNGQYLKMFSFSVSGQGFDTGNDFWKGSPTVEVLAKKMFVSFYLFSDQGFNAGFNFCRSTVRVQLNAQCLFMNINKHDAIIL